jgi:predicted hotdog family 3-hydroxylacyl-ACP dehydratase
MSRIRREQILTLIPHAGAMCLLDEVLVWDEASVRCLSYRFRDQDNPMRRADGTLGTACGIEIAAQAMAVHGRLTAQGVQEAGAPVLGYLVSLRDVRLATACLDAAIGPIVIDARRLTGDARGAGYSFTVADQEAELLSGRATVLLGAGP